MSPYLDSQVYIVLLPSPYFPVSSDIGMSESVYQERIYFDSLRIDSFPQMPPNLLEYYLRHTYLSGNILRV